MRVWDLLLLMLMVVAAVRGDLFHYYKLKKFLTAVAFARALGKRPTILPVPIPIPIPISQNEVIRLPASSAKSFMTLTGSPKYSSGGSSVFTGSSFGGNSRFTGSSSFGYPLPGTFDSGGTVGGSKIIMLDSSKLLDGNNFGSNLLNGNNFGNNLLDGNNFGSNLLDGNNFGRNLLDGGDYASSSNVIRLVSGKPKRYFVRHPGRIILAGGGVGGRTMRTSAFMNMSPSPPMRQFHAEPPTEKPKKPIPVGERFRLP